ncbi:MAG: response regulator, partial [Caldiserica bacterium]|nr:response regulator [Caldisericota bacterium]
MESELPGNLTYHSLYHTFEDVLPAAEKLAELIPMNILVAEDNAINQKVAIRIFEKMGYRIHIAANGLEVLAALEENR